MKITYKFGKESLSYTLEDDAGLEEVEVGYYEITGKRSTLKDKKSYLKTYAIYLFILGFLIKLGDYFSGNPGIFGNLFIIGGGIYIIMYAKSLRSYTLLKTIDGAGVPILRDKKHDDLIVRSKFKPSKTSKKRDYLG